MKKLIPLFVCAAPLALSLAPAWAQAAGQPCSAAALDVVGHLLKAPKFRVSPDGQDGTITSAACKAHPVDKRLTIVSAAYDAGDADAKALVVALVDEAQRQVAASYKGKIEEDAAMRIEAASLRVDTPPYVLASGVRAFGIDVTSGYMPNCGDGGFGAVRTLYVQEGTGIRPILGDFTMSHWRYIQQGQSRCTGTDAPEESITENIKMSLAMSDKATNGYRDIIVTAISTRDDGKASTRSRFRQDLRYDGQRYPTKELDAAFDKWRAQPLAVTPR